MTLFIFWYVSSFADGEVATVAGKVTDTEGIPLSDKILTCRSDNAPTVTTNSSEDGRYSVQLQTRVVWHIQLGGVGVENKIVTISVPEGGVYDEVDIVTARVSGTIREVIGSGVGFSRPADVHVGLTEKTIEIMKININSDLDAAHTVAATVHDLRANVAVPQIAVDQTVTSLRRWCNLYAQHTICLKDPPPELQALHDNFSGNASVLNIPTISGPEVDRLENELFDKLMARRVNRDYTPCDENVISEDATHQQKVNHYSKAMGVDIETSAQKYSVGTSGIFANWKRRRFTLSGCVLTYFNGPLRAGGMVVDATTKVSSDDSKALHPQSKHFERELLIEFAKTTAKKEAVLLMRFDEQATKVTWEHALRDLICFLNLAANK